MLGRKSLRSSGAKALPMPGTCVRELIFTRPRLSREPTMGHTFQAKGSKAGIAAQLLNYTVVYSPRLPS